MPRRSKGPRLYLRAPRSDRGAAAVWVIRDGSAEISTGVRSSGTGVPESAQQALAAYIASKWQPPEAGRAGDPAAVLVVECLAFYQKLKVPKLADPIANDVWIASLSEWWCAPGRETLADVRMSTCDGYIAHRTAQPIKAAKYGAALEKRVSVAAARRELEVLSAAITFWAKEYPLSPRPTVSLPTKDESARDALTRDQAAYLLKAAMGYRRIDNGEGRPRWRRLGAAAIANRAHLRRFIIIGLYSGSRPGVTPKLLWHESPTQAWVDIEAGRIFRRGKAEREHRTKRRTMVTMPKRLLAHMQRWKDADEAMEPRPSTVLHHGGRALAGRIRRGFEACVRDAGLDPDITPHWLRHTCATWLMEGGADLWDAAGFTGMTSKVLEEHYGHHRPDHQAGARKALGGKR